MRAVYAFGEAIDKAYIASGKVFFAFRQFPLESIHPHALPAAEAAECAAAQGQFWKMHDLTFADQSHLDDTAAHLHAAPGGLLRLPARLWCLSNTPLHL